ncbi:hypothetical protein M0R45_022721 [Rubus argutus]|uniref:Uncharacterized protein n=1 Tax=Rubus argutus TaxID=59490 RepID=A0AAW1XFF0_RUBAR
MGITKLPLTIAHSAAGTQAADELITAPIKIKISYLNPLQFIINMAALCQFQFLTITLKFLSIQNTHSVAIPTHKLNAKLCSSLELLSSAIQSHQTPSPVPLIIAAPITITAVDIF